MSKLALRDYLEARTRFKEVLVEGTRQVEVIRPLTWRNVDYPGPNPKDFHRLGQMIELPASVAKSFRREYKVRLIGADYQSGPWDHYRIPIGEKSFDGFKPWDSLPSDYPGVPRLAESEYDNCWLPVRDRRDGRGDYDPVVFLLYGLAQKLPLRGPPFGN